MNRQEKAQVIEGLASRVSEARIAVVTDFKGLSVEQITDLRDKLREAGLEYKVVKNTLACLAFKGTVHEILGEHMKENCAVALGFDDPVALAKVLSEYAKGNKKFSVKFGSLMGQFLEPEKLSDLAKLPSRPELLAQLLGTMNAVPGQFVGLLANVQRNFLYALNAIKDQKEAA